MFPACLVVIAFAADLDAENETAVLSSEPLEDATNVSQAITSMIYCVHGSVCRGGWTWTGPKKVCRGGFYCAPTMAFAADLGAENETTVLSSEPLEDATNMSHSPHLSETTAIAAFEHNHSEAPMDMSEISEALDNMIYCRYGTSCVGGWTWTGPKKICKGGFRCLPVPAAAPGCHGVKVCRGGWTFFGGRKVCHGGFACR